jgi:hypothetical protein
MRVSIIAAVALACGLSSLGCGAIPKDQKGLIGDITKTAEAAKKGDIGKAVKTVEKSEAGKTAEAAVKKEATGDKGDKKDEGAGKEGHKADAKKVDAGKLDGSKADGGRTDGKVEGAKADGGSKPDASKVSADKKDEGTATPADPSKPNTKRGTTAKKPPVQSK